MEITYHRLISRDLHSALDYYEKEAGVAVADRFFDEVELCLKKIQKYPEGNHFSDRGYRRAQLNSFPYHILYDVDSWGIWIAILRHDRRHPSYGMRRNRRG